MEIVKLLRPKITIIDASYAMDRNGPIFGDVVKMNTLIATDNSGVAEVGG